MNDTLLWYTTRGSGVVSLLLLSGVVVLGVLTSVRFESRAWPRFLTAGLHRNLALTSVVFAGLHVVTAVVDPFAHLGWATAIVPFASWYRPFWIGLGTVSAELGLAIVATSLLRRMIGPVVWRAVHWLAYASWPLAVVHSWGSGTDAGSEWMIALDVICVGAVLFAVVGRLAAGPQDPLAEPRSRFRGAAERPDRQ